MEEAIRAILSLRAARGAIAKKNVIQNNSENEKFRKLLYYALHPLMTYNVSEKTLRESMTYDPSITLTMSNIFEVCETLSDRRALDNATVYQLKGFLNSIHPVEQEVYIKLLAKTLRLGVTEKTVNKVIPGLIPEWEVQQAYPIEKYPIKPGTWFSLSEKLNGVRATYYRGQLRARSGEVYRGLDHIVDSLSVFGDEYVFDGELTLLNKGNLSDNEAFRIATGIINSDSEHKTEICYTFFDVLPAAEFDSGQSSATYSERRAFLDSMSERFSDGFVRVLDVLYSGTDQQQISNLLDRMVREDKEGLMANLDVPYKCKRHNGILKVKRFYTMDLPIIRCEEGSGRLSGTLGSLVLDYHGNEVNVGSGFTDEQRDWYWERRDDLIGILCEVKYKEISRDKRTCTESLQFPVFVQLREDKSEVSYG